MIQGGTILRKFLLVTILIFSMLTVVVSADPDSVIEPFSNDTSTRRIEQSFVKTYRAGHEVWGLLFFEITTNYGFDVTTDLYTKRVHNHSTSARVKDVYMWEDPYGKGNFQFNWSRIYRGSTVKKTFYGLSYTNHSLPSKYYYFVKSLSTGYEIPASSSGKVEVSVTFSKDGWERPPFQTWSDIYSMIF